VVAVAAPDRPPASIAGADVVFMRQSAPMDSRRGGRPPQVRPRPPSSGRPSPVRVRPIAPSPTRLARHRRLERRQGLPLPARAFLAFSIAALGLTIVWVGSGAVGPFVSGVVRGFGGFVGQLGGIIASPTPTAAPLITGAPSIVPPDEAYTNLETVDITVNVPPDAVGRDGYSVRLWDTLKDSPATVLAEAPVGSLAALVIPGVALGAGRNDIQASLVGPAGEGERSAVVTWVLDQVPPKITITSPKDGASVTKTTVTIKGTTQARSAVVLRNDANGATASTQADPDGLFQVDVAVAAGTNAITITATDPAGNANSQVLNLRKGSGQLTASLTGTVYRFAANKLPRNVTFTVLVTGPDGRPVQGATALFTVSVPGLEAIVSGEIVTGQDGTASFSTTIPAGAMAGSGLATVLVTTTNGTATDRQVLTVS
jgi:hypothetical protein